MRLFVSATWLILTLACVGASSLADELPTIDDGIRIMSWNVSDDAFVSEPRIFQALLGWADPDVVLLDEVAPSASGEQLIHALDSVRSDRREPWTVSIGVSGGRQRCVIASRMPQEALPEFASIVPYPDADRRYLLEKMSGKESAYSAYSMEGGIPVNLSLIHISEPTRPMKESRMPACA